MPDVDRKSRTTIRRASHDWKTRASGMRRGESGGRTSANGNGERCARTTARTAMRGSTFPTITRDRAPTTGARTGSRAFSDLKQRLCFALTLWNGKDPILKERLFGLSNGEGNHGEDVKEYYFYLDSTPTHSYMKWLYKYPAGGLPVRRPREDECAPFTRTTTSTSSSTPACSTRTATSTSSSSTPSRLRRNASSGSPSRIGARRPRRFICCRPCGSATPGPGGPGAEKPHLKAATGITGASVVAASHPELGDRWLYCDGAPPLLFTENETNTERLFGTPNASPYVKDAFHAFVVHGNTAAVNPAAGRHQGGRPLSLSRSVPASRWRSGSASPMRRSRRVRSRRSTRPSRPGVDEADEFYQSFTPDVGQRRHRATSCGRRSAASSGRSSTTSSTSTCGCASTA